MTEPITRLPRATFLLFCSTGLGDSLFCTPAIRFLRAQLPDCRIGVVVKHKLGDLFSTNPHIDRLIPYRNTFLSRVLARRVIRRSGPYQAIFFFHVGQEVVQLIRGAHYQRLHCVQQLADLPADARVFPIDIRTRRQWEDFSAMVALECGGECHDHEFQLPVPPGADAVARDYFARLREAPQGGGANPCRPLRIGLQLGGSHLGKCWPPNRFAQLACAILSRHPANLFVNATKRETPLWDQFTADLTPELAQRCHKLPEMSAVGFAAILRKLDLFVSNDTGPLHVALSQDCPVVALKAHDDDTWPYTLPRETPLRRSLFIRTGVKTSGRDYQSSHRAMECIAVECVLAEVESVIGRKQPPRRGT